MTSQYDELFETLYGLCHLVLYYPVGNEKLFRVVYDFDQPPTKLEVLALIGAFYDQPYTQEFATAIEEPFVPQSKVSDLQGDDVFLLQLRPYKDGYKLFLED